MGPALLLVFPDGDTTRRQATAHTDDGIWHQWYLCQPWTGCQQPSTRESWVHCFYHSHRQSPDAGAISRGMVLGNRPRLNTSKSKGNGPDRMSPTFICQVNERLGKKVTSLFHLESFPAKAACVFPTGVKGTGLEGNELIKHSKHLHQM